MKKLKQARAKTQRLFLIGFACIIALMCFAATPTFKAGAKATGATSAIFMGGAAFKYKPDPEPTGGNAEAEVLIKVKAAGAEAGKKAATDAFASLIEDNAEIKKIRAIQEKIDKAVDPEQFNAIKDEIVVLKGKIEEGKTAGASKESKLFADLVMKELTKLATTEIIPGKKGLSLYSDKYAKANFVIKASTLTTGTITAVGTNAIAYELADIRPGVEPISRRPPFIMEICARETANNMQVQWAEINTPTDGAASVSEGSGKPQSDFEWVEKNQKVEKFAAFMKVSREALADVTAMENAIRTELVEQITLLFDVQLLTGNGSTPNLNGLARVAQAWAAGSFANAIDYANYMDVLIVAYNQIVTSSGGDTTYAANFRPNYIVLNPTDLTKIKTTKTTYGQYVIAPFMTPDGTVIADCRVIESAGMTAGKFLIGDFTKAHLAMREEVNVQIGYDGSDFTNNLVTILAELRGTLYVKSNHVNAFVYGTFSTALAALKDTKS